jgi:hypothetical protein
MASKKATHYKDIQRWCSLTLFTLKPEKQEVNKKDWLIVSSSWKFFCFFCICFKYLDESYIKVFPDSHMALGLKHSKWKKSKYNLHSVNCWINQTNNKIGTVDVLLKCDLKIENQYLRDMMQWDVEYLKLWCED